MPAKSPADLSAEERTAFRKTAHIVHPAQPIVERIERMWEPDQRVAHDRANLIVQRLIETGHLPGRMYVDCPLAPESAKDDPA